MLLGSGVKVGSTVAVSNAGLLVTGDVSVGSGTVGFSGSWQPDNPKIKESTRPRMARLRRKFLVNWKVFAPIMIEFDFTVCPGPDGIARPGPSKKSRCGPARLPE